jgi:hypothetical protein
MPVVLRGRGPSNGLLFFLVDAPDVGGSVAGSRVAFLAAGWTVEWFRSCGCEHGCRNSYGGVSHDCDRGGAVDALACALLRSGWSVSADCAARRDAAVVEVATHGGDGEALHGTAARRIGLQVVR